MTILSDLQEPTSPAALMRLELGETTRDTEVDAHARESTFDAVPSFKKRSAFIKDVFGGGGGSGSSESSPLQVGVSSGAEPESVVKFALTLDGDSADFDEASVRTIP